MSDINKNKKSITIFTQFFPPDFASTGQLLNDLANAIAEKSKYKIKVITGQPSYAFSRSNLKKENIESKLKYSDQKHQD